MIDAGTCRYDLLKYGGYLSIVFEEKIRKLIKNGYLPEQAEKIQLDEIEDDIFSNYMDLFIEQIYKLYHKEQIILVDCQPVSCFVSQARDRVGFFEHKTIEKWHANINRGYRYLRKKLTGCHVIEFPKGIVGDEGHKWGNTSLHYIPEYYEYALEAVDIITQEKLSYGEECEKLLDLKERYEDLMKLKYEPIIVKTFQQLKERDKICKRMTIYEEYMKDLLLHEGKLFWIRNFMKEKQFEHCSFYGLNELSKFFIKIFRRWGIRVDYVIEDTKISRYEDIPCIARREKYYPETQVIIVADVSYTDRIKEKLKKMGVSYPYYDVYEILQ